MPENGFDCHSDVWMPDIIKLGSAFLEYLSQLPGGKNLVFKDDLIGYIHKKGLMVEDYNQDLKKLKTDIFGSDSGTFCADHHKIAALYIRAFLKHKPFRLDVNAETDPSLPSLMTKLPNEHFSIVFLATILKAFNAKNGIDGELVMDKEYRGNFVKLLYHYRMNTDRLDPLSLSNTIFLIEQRYFIPKTGP